MLTIATRIERRRAATVTDHASGFTLVEVLTSIGVIGLLVAITLPAIQASREVSRRTTCSSHIRQLAVASQNHAATHGTYPDSAPLEKLLPFVEALRPKSERDPQVEVYQCPAESHPDWGTPWSHSYYFNNGSHIYYTPLTVVPQEGVVSYNMGIRPRDVSDGESNTAMLSERQLAPVEDRYATQDEVDELYRRYSLNCIWRTGATFLHGQEDAFLAACGDMSRRQRHKHVIPMTNSSLGDSDRFYKHVLPPNVPGCVYYELPRLEHWVLGEWDMPANSGHPGGVNVALCDAATKFVANEIDIHVWRAIGTRNGGDLIGSY